MNTEPHWSEDVVAHGLGGLKRLSGYYHENFVAEHEGVNYLIRIVREQWKDMDFRMLDENTVLHFLSQHSFPSPRLLYVSETQKYSVHEYIDGVPVNALYPKHKTLSPSIIESMAGLMARTHALPTSGLAAGAKHAVPNDNNAFLAQLLAYVKSFYQALWNEAPDVYAELDFPNDPFGAFDSIVGKLTNRSLVLCHSDVHQHNLILSTKGEQLYLLDWELAVLGDRLYDISLSASRSYMELPQIDQMVFAYQKLLPSDISAFALRAELEIYLNIEYIRKAVSDAYRLHKAMLRPGAGDDQDIQYKRDVRFPSLMQKARKVWAEQ